MHQGTAFLFFPVFLGPGSACIMYIILDGRDAPSFATFLTQISISVKLHSSEVWEVWRGGGTEEGCLVGCFLLVLVGFGLLLLLLGGGFCVCFSLFDLVWCSLLLVF